MCQSLSSAVGQGRPVSGSSQRPSCWHTAALQEGAASCWSRSAELSGVFRSAILQQGDEESAHSGDVTVGKLPLQVGAAKCWTNKPDSDLQVLGVLIKVQRRPRVRGIMEEPRRRW